MSQALFSELQEPLFKSKRNELIRAFLKAMPEESVLREAAEVLPFESDRPAVAQQQRPMVTLSGTVEQDQQYAGG